MTTSRQANSPLPEASVTVGLEAVHLPALLERRQLLEESQWESTGPAQTRVHRPPRSLGGLRHQLCSCLDQPHRPVLDVLNLESQSDLPVGQMSDLDFIDDPTLRWVS